MKDRMQAARFYSPGIIKQEEIKIPSIGSREILVNVKTALTCGTDVKIYRRGHPKVRPPIILGHEFSGTVAKVGSKIEKQFQVGDRIVMANSAPCNRCIFCKNGKQNLCEKLEETLLGFSLDGSFADYIRIPTAIVDQNAYKIPDDISFEEAALLEPLACAVNGSDAANISIGDSIVIIGSGPIGLLHLRLAKLKGASKIIMTDIMKKRLNIAKIAGADFVIDASKEDQLSRVKDITEGKGADIVIEAVGLPETWELALRMTRKAGTSLFFGGCPSGTSVNLDTNIIHYGNITIKGVFHHTPFSVLKAYRLILSHRFKGQFLVTDKIPLSKLEIALQRMYKGESLKIAIIP